MMDVIQSIYTAQDGVPIKRETSFWRWIFLYLILFGLEFDIDIIGPITLRKLAFIMVLLYIGRKGVTVGLAIRKDYVIFGMATVILFVYAIFIQCINVSNTSIPGNSIYPAIQILFQWLSFFLFPVMFTQIFLNVDEFLKAQLAVISTQAMVAIISRQSLSFRMFIYNRFVPDDGRLLEGMQQGIRVGILGGAGATGSWIMFIGCVICAYYLLKTRKIRYLLIYFIILLSMMFIGRTGLYMGLLLLAFLTACLLYWCVGLAMKIMCVGILGILAIAGYILFAPDGYLKARTIIWVGEIFLRGFGEGSTVQMLVDMGIPPLNWETFWGTGIECGTTASGIVAKSDIGYIHTYMAFGIVGAVIYYTWAYGFITYELLKVEDRYIKWTAAAFLLFIIIVELKEPFLRKTPNAMVLILMLFLTIKQEQKYIGEKYGKYSSACIRYMPKLQP